MENGVSRNRSLENEMAKLEMNGHILKKQGNGDADHRENGIRENGKSQTAESGLAFIECANKEPLELFKDWLATVRHHSCVLPEALILSTATQDGKVSSRTLLLRRLEEDGIVIMTDNRSRKVREIGENPRVAMVFLWNYLVDGKTTSRQVRIEGKIEKLSRPQFQDLYDREPFYCKVRAHICHQDRPTDWADLKERHDSLVEKVLRDGLELPMPDHFIAFKVYPDTMEFYYASENLIGDRLVFKRSKSSEEWQRIRVTA